MGLKYLEVSDREPVVLLDERDRAIGQMSKGDVHHSDTPLHLAFSVFIFDSQGRMLVQRRALHKRTWPGVWSNSCCGHPLPGESFEDAIARRLSYEIGVLNTGVELVLPDFRYRACWGDVWENELCPVFVGFSDDEPNPNPAEVAACDWVDWKRFSEVCHDPVGTEFENFSPWSFMEGCALLESTKFEVLMRAKGNV